MKVTMKLRVVNSIPRWVVDWKVPGEPRKRRFFSTKGEAEKEKKALEGQHEESGSIWSALDKAERTEIGLLIRRVRAAGYTLRQACDFYEQGSPGTTMLLGVAFEKFIAEKSDPKKGLSPKTLQALKSNIGRFIVGREELPLARIRREDIASYLQRPEWGPRTYNSYLISFNTFFRWCVKSELLTKSPAASLDKIGKKQMPDLDKPPAVLTSEQCRRLLRAALESDRGLIPYVALGIFAGLRPMREAGHLLPEDIDRDMILVRGANAKDRQRRHVEIHPTLKSWLALGGDYHPKNFRRRFENLRLRAGLIKHIKVEGKVRKQIEASGWEQDCLRHTFASHYLPVFGAEKTVTQMGHGDYTMLFTHYRKLIAKDEAERFWSELTPENLIATLFDPKTIVVDQDTNDVAAQAGDAGVTHVVHVPPQRSVAGESFGDRSDGKGGDPNPESDAHGAPEKFAIAA